MTTHSLDASQPARLQILPPTLRVPWPKPGAGRAMLLHGIVRVGALLTVLGLVTISWERLADIHVGAYNVKLPSVAFSLAAVCLAPAFRAALRRMKSRGVRALAVLCVLIFALFVIRALFEPQPLHGLAQVLAVVTGAVAPAVAVFAVVGDVADLLWVLDWFVRGGVLAAAFGLYQLLAFYLHWPQFVNYSGVAVGGTVGRIAAFNYEPAYFAYYLVLVVGALLVRMRLRGVRFPWAAATVLGAALTFADVRALLFVAPAFLLLLALGWRGNRGSVLRLAALAVVLIAVVLGVDTAVKDAVATPAIASPEGSSPTARASSSGVPEASETAVPTADGTAAPVPGETVVPSPSPAGPVSPTSIFDPHEATSNAPRIAMYKAALQVDLRHPFTGVGPGELGSALQGSQYVRVPADSTVVANNIWLQAAADGGAPMLLLELAVAIGVATGYFRSMRSAIQPLFAVWIAVLGVAGMLTSYYFDSKIWAVLGMLGAASCVIRVRSGARCAEH